MQPAMIYQPSAENGFRVAWYGGESTQLHFEKLWNVWDPDTDNTWEQWEARDIRTIGSGIPTQIKEMLILMEDYYHDSMILEQERLHSLM